MITSYKKYTVHNIYNVRPESKENSSSVHICSKPIHLIRADSQDALSPVIMQITIFPVSYFSTRRYSFIVERIREHKVRISLEKLY